MAFSKDFWENVPNFKELENRPDIEGVEGDVLFKLQELRILLGKPIIVSPVIGAIVATDGHAKGSYHYKGRAIDVFPICHPALTLGSLTKHRLFGGIGFYFDTHYKDRPCMMLHLDTRPFKSVELYNRPTYWFRDNGKYYYFSSFREEEVFWSTLIEKIMNISQFY